MKHLELRRHILELISRGNHLEAFLIQSAYIEGVLKAYAEFYFELAISNGNKSAIVPVLKDNVRRLSFERLIDFLHKAKLLSNDEREKFHNYRRLRNQIVHDLVKEVSDDNFKEELLKGFSEGELILKNKKLSVVTKIYDIRETALKVDASIPLRTLTEREKEALRYRLEFGYTLQKAADHMGLTRERVRQLVISGISKIENVSVPGAKPSIRRVEIADVISDAEAIIASVAQAYNVSVSDIMSYQRPAELVLPRQLAMYYVRERLKLSYPNIAKVFHKKDHTTIMHACEKIQRLLRD